MAHKIVQENIELVREDGGTYTFKPVKGNYAGRLNYVTFRKDFDPVTGDRLIEKSSTAGQVRCTYNASRNESTFEFDYLPNDTRDRPQSQLVYDITSSATDASDVKTPKRGYCSIIGDVRNDLNGTNLPSAAERYIPVLASQLTVGKLVKVGANNYTNSTNTDEEIASAVSLKHNVNAENSSHYTKSANDLLLAAKIDKVTGKQLSTEDFTTAQKNSITREDAIYNYLFNGALDENDTILSLDENNLILQIDEGIK